MSSYLSSLHGMHNRSVALSWWETAQIEQPSMSSAAVRYHRMYCIAVPFLIMSTNCNCRCHLGSSFAFIKRAKISNFFFLLRKQIVAGYGKSENSKKVVHIVHCESDLLIARVWRKVLKSQYYLVSWKKRNWVELLTMSSRRGPCTVRTLGHESWALRMSVCQCPAAAIASSFSSSRRVLSNGWNDAECVLAQYIFNFLFSARKDLTIPIMNLLSHLSCRKWGISDSGQLKNTCAENSLMNGTRLDESYLFFSLIYSGMSRF